MAVVTRVKIASHSLRSPAEARRETEELLDQFRILYPDATVVRNSFAHPAGARLCGHKPRVQLVG